MLAIWTIGVAVVMTAASWMPSMVLAQGPRPLIGILSEPWNVGGSDAEYIAASYVKWAEQMGARVVALQYSMESDLLMERVKRLHGVIMPGGGNDIHPHHSQYMNSTQLIYDYTVSELRSGRMFPLWGTCLGWEELAELSSDAGASVLDDSGSFESERIGLPLKFTEGALENSTMFSTMTPELKIAAATQPISYNAHTQGVTPEAFASHAGLPAFWRVLATSTDLNGKEFIAAAESKDFVGIFAVQFHPEKAQFEWKDGALSLDRTHAEDGVALSQHLANVFASFVRQRALSHPTGSEANLWDIELEAERLFLGVTQYFIEVFVLLHRSSSKNEPMLRGTAAVARLG